MSAPCRYCTTALYSDGSWRHHPDCPNHPENTQRPHMLIPDDLASRAHGETVV